MIAYNRTPQPDAGVPLVDIDTLLGESDVVSLNLVLDDETRGFLTQGAHRAHETGRDSASIPRAERLPMKRR